MRLLHTLSAAIIVAASFSSIALAQSSSGSQSNNQVNVGVNSYGSRTYRDSSVKTVGNAIAPGLTAGAIVCAQSTSAGAGFMGGAVSFGTTRADKDCNDRAWMATIAAMASATNNGRYMNAAHNIACSNATAGKALREAGFVCPGSGGQRYADEPETRTVSYGAPQVRVSRNVDATGSAYVSTLPKLPSNVKGNVRVMKRDGVKFARVSAREGQFRDYRIN